MMISSLLRPIPSMLAWALMAALPATAAPQVETRLSANRTSATLANAKATLTGTMELRLTGAEDPLAGSLVNFASPDAWLILEKVPPAQVTEKFLGRLWVSGKPAVADTNLRITQYGSGSVLIPHAPDHAAMTVFDAKGLAGPSQSLQTYVKYDDAALGKMKGAISSFRLKRGYMATIAQEENGTGISRNYVAQDHDVEIRELPEGLDNRVRFIRIFPWCWSSKKGVGGNIAKGLNVGWYYDWNINANSTPALEYVPIRQNRWWPDLRQDWKVRGATHLLGYNEPDRPDQAKMSVGDAIHSWPDLLATGLRLGSPAVSDGGLAWLYEFMEKADAAKLRVDFVAVHYYRATDPKNPRAAADQFYNYLKGIHDKVKRPLWVTEWNNGANWTNAGDPTPEQQKDAVAAMLKMLDKTDFVERYAIYNWVEDCRAVQRKDGSPTPAGEVYRDKESPVFYKQMKY